MNAPWLFAEAYKYRRLRECFSLSKFWVDYGMSLPHIKFHHADDQMSSSDRSAIPSQDPTRPSLSSHSDSLPLTSTRRDSLRPKSLRRTSSSSLSSPRVSNSLVSLTVADV
jgi:hypothetical protein